MSMVEEFLAPFRQGRPPFVLSDGFPGDLLPRPFLPTPMRDTTSRDEHAAAGSRARSMLVRPADFQAIRRDASAVWQSVPDQWKTLDVPHAGISRTTSTTAPDEEGETGRFFQTQLKALAAGDTVSLYLRAEADWGERVPEMLAEMAPLGFGRDRSTGAGAFELIGVEEFEGFEEIEGANGFISLSSYCPARNDPTKGRWRLRLKRGKLGENAGGGNPFKRPLIQFEPGAVFVTDGPLRPYYGRAVADIAPGMPEAIQCCYTLAVPAVLPAETGE